MSITGKAWHSMRIDKAHEMGINKDCKTCIVQPTKDYISQIAHYILCYIILVLNIHGLDGWVMYLK